MKFGSWTFTGDQVSLSLFNNKNHVDLSDYWKSGTWDIIEVPAYLNVHNNTGISKQIKEDLRMDISTSRYNMLGRIDII